ncbi:MAG: tetratricopeptide repeat protein [Pirellulaceae bacterium]|nr:tetratricopeptide repeat protein [Pirellulaceae bacterium]
MGWTELWLTPDQLGQRLYRKGQYTEAAKSFRDVNWQGVAWYRAGEFERAAQTLGNLDTPSAHFNTGNAWLMLGKYQVAADCYARAIAQQPNWLEAIENRDLALARAKLIERTGADLGDQQIGADKVVFDKDAKNEGQETEVEGTQPLPDAAIQELWLRRVQTRPADFLRSKFSHQQTLRQYSGESPE